MPRAEREQQLIAIAEDIFARNGYAGTTMEAIAEAAGITKPVIYDPFGSKDGLLAALVDKARNELVDTLRQAWRTADPAQGVRGVYRDGLIAFFRFMDAHATAWRATVEDHALATTPGAMNSLRAAQTQIVVDGLRTQPQLASVPDFVLEGFAEGVIGACERIAAWRITRPECTAEVATELVMAVTWTGLERVAGSTLHTAGSEAKPPLRTAG